MDGGRAGPLPVILVTDYGRRDEFAGILHLVIERTAPGTPVVDLTHDLPAHDIRAGALVLWRAVPWLAPGVVLAVVDPGVGTDRRAVAIETEDAAGLWLVGPDNGLLRPAALAAGGVRRAVTISADGPPPLAAGTQSPLPAGSWRPTVAGARPASARVWGPTFAGRDLFAPAAAALAGGADLATLGPPVDPDTLLGDAVTDPVPTADGLTCEALWVDRFGNVQLNARPGDLDGLGPELAAVVGVPARTVPLARATTYAGLAGAAVGLVTDSYGLCALSADRGDAAAALGLRAGDPVLIAARPAAS